MVSRRIFKNSKFQDLNKCIVKFKKRVSIPGENHHIYISGMHYIHVS